MSASLSDFINPTFWAGLATAAFSKPAGASPNPSAGTGPLTNSDDDPYSRSYDEIITIQQKGSKGFRVVDIDPRICTRDLYSPLVSVDQVTQLVGGESDAIGEGFTAESVQLPFWRTVAIPAVANWVKIEYLPSAVNDFENFTANFPDDTSFPTYPNPNYTQWDAAINNPPIANSNGNATQYIAINSGTQNFGAGNLSFNAGDIITFNGSIWHKTGTDSVLQTLANDFTVKYASERLLLVNFEDTTTPPILAKHGDVFDLPFNTIYLSFKIWSPRIRLTIGYNAKIQAVDDRQLMMSPAFGPGHGLLANPYLHSVPFSLNSEDLGVSFAAGFITTNSISDVYETIISNPVNASDPNNNGSFVGWITSLNYSLSAISGSSLQNVQGLMECYIATVSGLTPVRRLFSITNAVAVNSNNNSANISQQFNDPIRFNLHTGECLVLRFHAQMNLAASANHNFGLEGYTFGNMVGSGIGAAFCPFFPAYKLVEEAYPQDRFTQGAPR